MSQGNPRGKRAGAQAYQRSRHYRPRQGKSGTGTSDASSVTLYGWHSVKAALENPNRRIRRLLATENAARRLAEEGIPCEIEPELVRPDAIARRLTADAVHNGILAEADALSSLQLEDIPPAGMVLLLDQITDPHNVGAIMRVAAAFDVAAVITTARHSPQASGVLAKSASGALESVPLVAVQNLAHAMDTLRAQGFFVLGLDGAAEGEFGQTNWTIPLGLVLGAEGKGLRQRTKETCDALARLHLPGKMQTLNVSNAAALALYIATSRTTG
jgi:23S rRNA (guanosine2251-2'-O)-methyltransferase